MLVESDAAPAAGRAQGPVPDQGGTPSSNSATSATVRSWEVLSLRLRFALLRTGAGGPRSRLRMDPGTLEPIKVGDQIKITQGLALALSLAKDS